MSLGSSQRFCRCEEVAMDLLWRPANESVAGQQQAKQRATEALEAPRVLDNDVPFFRRRTVSRWDGGRGRLGGTEEGPTRC